MKYIDDIVWWIPIKKLRNSIRTYLLNKINREEKLIQCLNKISEDNVNILKYLNESYINNQNILKYLNEIVISNKDILNYLNKNFKILKIQEDTHPIYLLRKKSASNTALYIENNNNKAVMFYDKFQLLKFSLETIKENFNTQEYNSGLFLEFGVFKGETINFCSKILNDTTFYGFDSFEGLPENWYGWSFKKKSFDTNGELPNKNNNVSFIKGYFENTLPPFMQEHINQNILFIHIDCDLYSSTKTILNNIINNIIPGTIIVFDEYFNYPNWEENEYKAFKEFCNEYGITYEYIGFADQQAAIKIIRAEQSRAEQIIYINYYYNNTIIDNKLQPMLQYNIAA